MIYGFEILFVCSPEHVTSMHAVFVLLSELMCNKSILY